MAEVDVILGVDTKDEEDDASLPPIPAKHDAITLSGDVWQLGPHRIICDDCHDAAVLDFLMGDSVASMVITDPPYNVRVGGHVSGKGRVQHAEFAMASGEMTVEAFTKFLTASLEQLARVSRDGALHYIFMDWRHLP